MEIIKRASRYFDDFLHMTETDEIQLMHAILIISKIGIDMTQFEIDKQLSAGLDFLLPIMKVQERRDQFVSTKLRQYLKLVLVQCALAVIKNKDSYFG